MIAPITPFITEKIWQELKLKGIVKEESVHLETYPVEDEKLIKPELEDAVSRMQQIILLGRQKRNQIQVKVKTPLKRITILHKDQNVLFEIKKLEDYIKVELNIKDIQYSTKESDYINLFAKPNSPVLGKKLGKRFAEFRQKIETLSVDLLAKLEAGETINISGEDFTQEDVLIFREAKPGTQALSNRSISIDMDCQLSDELISEGLAREIVNRIQKTRKEINLNVSDRIKIIYDASSDVEKAIIHHKDHISKETLTVSLSKGVPSNKNSFNYDIDSDFLKIEIIKA